MTAPTYGQLLDEAACELAGLHTLVSVSFRDPDDALATFGAWRRFAATSIRHAALLAPHDDLVTKLPRLRPARGDSLGVADSLHPAGLALARSRELLGLAHDVLATHLGPERQHRTPDAALIDRTGPFSPALRMLSSMLLTAAVAHQALARRAMEVPPIPSRVPAPVARVLREGTAILGPSARLMDRLRAQQLEAADALGRLTPATLLSLPGVEANPPGQRDQLAATLSRLRVAVHRQAHGDLVVGAATMRALTAVAIALIRRDLNRPSPRSHIAGQAPLRDADRAWTQLHVAWGQVRTLNPVPRAVSLDAVTALQLLRDEPCPARWGTGEQISTADWTSSVAESLSAAAQLLNCDGQILVPTGWCDGLDIPRAWTVALDQHVDRLADLHRAAATGSARLGRASSWTASQDTAMSHPVPEALLERVS